MAACLLFGIHGGTQLHAQTGSPGLTLSTASVKFGDVADNTDAKPQTVTLTSSGRASLTISAEKLTGPASFNVSGVKFPLTLKPGATAKLTITFDPTSIGVKSGTITLTSNSQTGKTSTIALSGTSMGAELKLSATSVEFGEVKMDTDAKPQTVTLTSTGTAPLTISDFTRTGPGCFITSGAGFPLTLKPGASAKLTISFDPTSPGAKSGSLTLTSNNYSNSKATITLSGKSMGPELTLSTTIVRFGSVNMNTDSEPQTVTLTSSGTTPLIISAATRTGPGSFVTSGASFPLTLEPGAKAKLTFSFDPTSPGDKSGALTLTSNNYSNSKATITLSGTSMAPVLKVSAASVQFGGVTVNTVSTQEVTLISSGTTAVTISGGSTAGAGFGLSGVKFPLTLQPGDTATLDVQFDPTAAGTKSGTVTLTSNSYPTATSKIAVSGTGETTSSVVDLSWDAPNDPSDPAVGYDIFRAESGSTLYQQLNATVDPSTSYTDSTVAGGIAYTYYVESVDAAGNKSVPSASYTVTVPM